MKRVPLIAQWYDDKAHQLLSLRPLLPHSKDYVFKPVTLTLDSETMRSDFNCYRARAHGKML